MGRSRIRLLAAGVAGFVVLVAVVTHFALPPYVEGRVEERLEEHGGVANVELRAVPAVRLLAGHGDRVEITGSGLEMDLEDDQDAFEHLNRFDEVDVDLTEVTAGPFEVASFRLESAGDDRYRINLDATASIQEVARVAGEQFGGELGGVIGGIAGGAVPLSSAPVPLRLDGELEARDGDVEMVTGNARVAGLPAGPVARLVTNAILSGL